MLKLVCIYDYYGAMLARCIGRLSIQTLGCMYFMNNRNGRILVAIELNSNDSFKNHCHSLGVLL